MHGPQRETFLRRKFVTIDEAKCVGCCRCIQVCPVQTVFGYDPESKKAFVENAWNCGGCMACIDRCPSKAIGIREIPQYRRAVSGMEKSRAPMRIPGMPSPEDDALG